MMEEQLGSDRGQYNFNDFGDININADAYPNNQRNERMQQVLSAD